MTQADTFHRRTGEQLRRDAWQIWSAGVRAVRADLLVRQAMHVEGPGLDVAGELFDLENVGRLVVVGAGKAGAGMALGLEQALGSRLADEKNLAGWVNVPADTVRPLVRIHLHPARPAGCNEPTSQGVAGSQEILRMLRGLQPDDLPIVLLSGGGSALMPLPADGVSLADKLAITRWLSAAGAPIEDLNTVRKHLSDIKGGRLAAACRARRMIVLVISDVLGDPLELIASGPTVADTSTAEDALAILDRYGARTAGVAPRVFDFLAQRKHSSPQITCQVRHFVIGNNAVAVDAAGLEAERLGYSHAMVSAKHSEGAAEPMGRHLAEMALAMRQGPGPDCLISGGEPTVTLVDEARRGLGGRNQQLVLAAAQRLADDSAGILVLSAGTDGEDGPTDAAGAYVDAGILGAASQFKLDPAAYLARNDAYHWFEPVAGLIKTGPTDTNVCDLRVVLVDRIELERR